MVIGNHGKRGDNARAHVTPQEPEYEFGIATHLCTEELHIAAQKILMIQKKKKPAREWVSKYFHDLVSFF